MSPAASVFPAGRAPSVCWRFWTESWPTKALPRTWTCWRVSDTISTTALCGLGQSACKPVLSTLRYFREEYLHHVVDHHCPVCNGRKRRLEIKAELCKGCGKCARNCPMEAISGHPRTPYVIDNEKCIHCGACWGACPFGAIDAIEEEG